MGQRPRRQAAEGGAGAHGKSGEQDLSDRPVRAAGAEGPGHDPGDGRPGGGLPGLSGGCRSVRPGPDGPGRSGVHQPHRHPGPAGAGAGRHRGGHPHHALRLHGDPGRRPKGQRTGGLLQLRRDDGRRKDHLLPAPHRRPPLRLPPHGRRRAQRPPGSPPGGWACAPFPWRTRWNPSSPPSRRPCACST